MRNIKWNKLLPAALAAGVLGWMFGSAVGCELIASVDRTRINQTTGGGVGGVGGNGGTAGTAGSGGEECSPACPNDTDCLVQDCVDGECVATNQPEGTECMDGVGDESVCDGAGTCVECTENADCDFDVNQPVCSGNQCVNPGCLDNILNNGETGLDDGNGNECGNEAVSGCAPCIENEGCNVAIDCLSFFCDTSGGGGAGGGAAGVCSECTAQGECPTDRWCDIAGAAPDRCEPDFVQGNPCGIAEQCPANNCNIQDGVCCSAPCLGLCQGCVLAKTGQADGTCAFITGGTDPDVECTVNVNTCVGELCSGTALFCENPPGNCRVAAGLCDIAETCNGAVGSGCPANGFQAAGFDCRPIAGPCDLLEECAGGTAACPADSFVGTGENAVPFTACATGCCDGTGPGDGGATGTDCGNNNCITGEDCDNNGDCQNNCPGTAGAAPDHCD